MTTKKRNIICSKCQSNISLLGTRYIFRNGKYLCTRHFVNDGLRDGDKLMSPRVGLLGIGTNDKQFNYSLLRKRVEG